MAIVDGSSSHDTKAVQELIVFSSEEVHRVQLVLTINDVEDL